MSGINTNKFERGKEYIVIKDYAYFHADERLVFIANEIFYRDRTEIDYYQLKFFDPTSGECKVLRYNSPKEVNAIAEHFSEDGGWSIPKAGSIEEADLTSFRDMKEEAIMRSFLPYFKSLIEGDRDTENWYYWIARHHKVLEKIMTRGDYLRLKINPYTELSRILTTLEQHHIPYPRFKWINQDI